MPQHRLTLRTQRQACRTWFRGLRCWLLASGGKSRPYRKDLITSSGRPASRLRIVPEWLKQDRFVEIASATLAAMSTQTIAEYLEEEREKASDNQLRTQEEAARIQPLQHGHHRTAKKSRMEVVAPIKAAARKKQKRKPAPVARKKPRAARKTAPKKRKKA